MKLSGQCRLNYNGEVTKASLTSKTEGNLREEIDSRRPDIEIQLKGKEAKEKRK